MLSSRYVFANAYANTYLLEGPAEWSRFEPCCVWNIPGKKSFIKPISPLDIFTKSLRASTSGVESILLGSEHPLKAINVVLKSN